ncbi:MAG: lamin tail domain-containing protein [Myxococcales bacterium]|nr:lamin tail domain-containing protein [Myxococcales bacterium]
MSLAAGLGACAAAEDAAGAPCASDLDCTRREMCVASQCVPLADDTLGADVGADDAADSQDGASEADTAVATEDSAVAPDTAADDDGAADVSEDTAPEEDVVDLCAGLCDPDELCDQGRCYCTPGLVRACGSKVGECRRGASACENGQWTECRGDLRPSREVCDGKDNDCNGVIDDGFTCEPPLAQCPAGVTLDLGEAAELVGGGLDPDGGPVSFAWRLVDAPDGAAEQDLGAEATQVFAPPGPGRWVLELCVTDDEGAEDCCEVVVQVTPPCEPPAPPGLTACGTSWDRRPIIQFAPVPPGVRYDLGLEGTPWATVLIAGQNYYRPPEPIPMGGAPPDGTEVTITGRACVGASEACCSAVEDVQVSLIEACTTPIAPSAANLVISEYLINGDNGSGTQGPTFEAGEAVEITNLSNCPVSLAGHHLRYCNKADCTSARRYENWGPADVIPPRGVYVTIRAPWASTCEFRFLPAEDDPEIFGIRRSTLDLVVDGTVSNDSGWFNNGGGALRVATGAYAGPFSGTTILEVPSYVGNQANCESVGFDALGACGEIAGGVIPTEELHDNQLGRLWHPCDAVVGAFPTTCF